MLTTAGPARCTASAYDQASWPGIQDGRGFGVGGTPRPAARAVPCRGAGLFTAIGAWPAAAVALRAGRAPGATLTSCGRQATMMNARARPLTTDAAMNMNTRPIRLIPAS